MSSSPRGKVVVAAPRGYCAGVDRAIATVERLLETHEGPIYVRREIVHNRHVVSDLQARGAIFVAEADEVPEGATVVFSAHGVSPAVRETAATRGLVTIDATCPLVSKVHREARRLAAAGDDIVLIGHAGHEEVEGTMGEAPERIHLVERADDVEGLDLPDPDRVAYLTQTTLSVDETRETIACLRERYPRLIDPPSEDICYATQNRQRAVKAIAPETDVIIVVGSRNSSNSVRLVEVAEEAGTPAHRVDSADELDPAWWAGATSVGVTSGASVPERLVQDVVARLGEEGYTEVVERPVVAETITFAMPGELRRSARREADRASEDGVPGPR
jgi:4-hydroxy-3-methylbut-2-enyl diphosphate reductase